MHHRASCLAGLQDQGGSGCRAGCNAALSVDAALIDMMHAVAGRLDTGTAVAIRDSLYDHCRKLSSD